MLAITGLGGLGANETLWSMSTGGCSGGQFNTYCTPWSGSAGKAYNCIGCSSVEQNQIAVLQGLLRGLVDTLGLQGQFGAGLTVTVDKIIGLNTVRAVGIVGMALASRDITPSDAEVVFAISAAYDARAGLAAKSVGSTAVQQAIQGVAKVTPGLIAFLQRALMELNQVSTPPVLPPPPGTEPPTVPPPTVPPPVVDFGRRKKVMLAGGLFFLATATGLLFAATNRSQRRRR